VEANRIECSKKIASTIPPTRIRAPVERKLTSGVAIVELAHRVSLEIEGIIQIPKKIEVQRAKFRFTPCEYEGDEK
jgi:hypothetical protein